MALNRFKIPSSFSSIRPPDQLTVEILPQQYLISRSQITYTTDRENQLGSGGSATVYKGTFGESRVAIKVYSLDKPSLPVNKNLLLKEAKELVALNHQNIIKCYGACVEIGAIVLELAEKIVRIDDVSHSIHSLRQLVDTIPSQFFGPLLRYESLYQIACGLDYLHQKKIIHGDLKCANVLVLEEEDWTFKLCDIGQAHIEMTTKVTNSITHHSKGSRQQPVRGTISFEAPEVFIDRKKTLKSDIYSFAMMMIELLNSELAYPWARDYCVGNAETISIQIMNAVTNGMRPTVIGDGSNDSNSYIGLMKRCWQQNGESRPSAFQLTQEIQILRGRLVNEEDDVLSDGNPSNLENSLNRSRINRQLTPSSYSPLSKTMLTRDVALQLNRDRVKRDLFSNGCYEVTASQGSNEQGNGSGSTDQPQSGSLADNVAVSALHPQISSEIEIVTRKTDDLSDSPARKRLVSGDFSSSSRTHLSLTATTSFSPTHPTTCQAISSIYTPSLDEMTLENDEGESGRGDIPDKPFQESSSEIAFENDEGLNQQSNVLDSPLEEWRRKAKREEEMKFQGYSATLLKVSLKPFQLQALHAYSSKKDTLIVQATGSGKSACFQIPAFMLEKHQYGLVIVPTLALGQDHQLNLTELEISSVFLNSLKREEVQFAFRKVPPEPGRPFPSVIISTPEAFFGGEKSQGAIDLVDRRALKFIAIDETHLIAEWRNFRPAFDKIKELKDRFKGSPLIALTATLKPSQLGDLTTQVLRDPLIIRGSIDRPNVCLNIAPYQLTKGLMKNKKNLQKQKEGGTEKNKWTETAESIIRLTGGKQVIAYCPFAVDCDLLCSAFLLLGFQACSYTGKDTKNDKSQIYKSMKDGTIDILVATKAFGMGVNLPSIRFIIQVGLPENLSGWMQELGRAGRDGQPAVAYLLVNENLDVGRLKYWTSSLTNTDERRARFLDFADVFLFYSNAVTGGCLRKFLLHFFDDPSANNDLQSSTNEKCCTGCVIRANVPFKVIPEIEAILRTIRLLSDKGMKMIYQTTIIEWLTASAGTSKWIKKYFQVEEYKKEKSYGFLSGMKSAPASTRIKTVLKQCFSMRYVSLNFDSLDNGIVVKHWTLTLKGKQLTDGELELPELPDPALVEKFISDMGSAPCDSTEMMTKSRGKKGLDIISKVITLMKDQGSWVKLEKKKQYEMLGFHHPTAKLLYVEDFTKLKCCPSPIAPDYIWDYINLPKVQSQGIREFTLGDNHEDQSVYLLRRARCAGVKICSGSDMNGPCQHAISNRFQANSCRNHPNTILKPSGECGHFFVYIQKKEESNQRWIGFLSNSTKEASHDHPEPVPNKLSAKLNADIGKAISVNPTLTGVDIRLGYGIGYNPTSNSLAAANRGTLANRVYSLKTDYGGDAVKKVIQDFDDLIKKKVDEPDANEGEDPEFTNAVLEKCTPYIRTKDFSGDFKFVFMQTPQMSEVLSQGTFVELDVTFPKNILFPYLLNVVCYNEETMVFQTVARVLLNRLTTEAYKIVIREIFASTTKEHPGFDHGQHVSAWIVDFSKSQYNALADCIGKKTARSHIVGCKVHYQRNVQKIAIKICGSDKESFNLFTQIAYKIPSLAEGNDTFLAFAILCDDVSLEEEKAKNFLTKHLGFDRRALDQALKVDTGKWRGAKSWAEWWSTPTNLAMFTKSFAEMTDAEWEVVPKTTNAVESLNKVSQVNSTLFTNMMERYYRIDRNSALESLASAKGVSIGDSTRKRREKNALRQQRSKRSKAGPSTSLPDDDDSDHMEADDE